MGFSRQAVSADSSGSFIGGDQLSALRSFISEGNKRLDAVNAITSNASCVVSDSAARLEAAEKIAQNYDAIAQRAVDAVYTQFPNGATGRQPRQCATEGKEKCKRDFVHYLRLINYSLVVGGTGPLDELAINGQREVYKALSIDPGTYVAGFTHMRNDGCAPRDLSPC